MLWRIIIFLSIFAFFVDSTSADSVKDIIENVYLNFDEIGSFGVARIGDEVLTRQCTCDEVHFCFLETWEHIECQFANTFLTETRPDKLHVIFANWSMHGVEGYCTPENFTQTYFKLDDPGYNATEDIQEIAEDAYHLCFIQETIKCFQKLSCDIQNHNELLMTVRVDTRKREDRYLMGLAIASASRIQAELMREAWFEKYNETFKTIEEINATMDRASKKWSQNFASQNAKLNDIILFSVIAASASLFLFLQ